MKRFPVAATAGWEIKPAAGNHLQGSEAFTGLFRGLLARLRPPSNNRGFGQPSGFDEPVQLDCIRREMEHALHDCTGSRRVGALMLVQGARSALDLWLLRPEILLVVAQDHGQFVATERVNALTPLFRGWLPRTMESSWRALSRC
jgi:hypothetical protein